MLLSAKVSKRDTAGMYVKHRASIRPSADILVMNLATQSAQLFQTGVILLHSYKISHCFPIPTHLGRGPTDFVVQQLATAAYCLSLLRLSKWRLRDYRVIRYTGPFN